MSKLLHFIHEIFKVLDLICSRMLSTDDELTELMEKDLENIPKISSTTMEEEAPSFDIFKEDYSIDSLLGAPLH
jgi:transcription initiation factor IIE alpha subunit